MFSSGGSYVRHCGAAAPPTFMVNFVFRSVYYFTLIFKFAFTRRVDNVSSLPKTLCTKLNIRHSFVFYGSTTNDDSLELWALAAPVFYSKISKDCVLSIKHSQTGTASWSCAFRSAGMASAETCGGLRNHFIRPGAGKR